MAQIEIYTTMFCPYCARAKKLLKQKQVEFREIDVNITAGAREEMLQRSGGQRTVPQIFIDDQHIGGSDELAALERSGALDPMLSAP